MSAAVDPTFPQREYPRREDDVIERIAQIVGQHTVPKEERHIGDDAAVLVMDRWGAIRPEVDLESLFANWRSEFLAAHSEGGLFQLTLHPDLIGRRAPMRHLATLVDFIAAYGNVWFATHEAVARHCLDNAGERAT